MPVYNRMIITDDEQVWLFIGNAMIRKRADLKVSQREAAAQVGVSVHIYNSYEQGKRQDISITIASKLERFLGWDASAIERFATAGIKPKVSEQSSKTDEHDLLREEVDRLHKIVEDLTKRLDNQDSSAKGR